MTEGMPGQEQAQGGRPRGDKNLPSTREWIEMRTQAIDAAAASGGMEAVAEAQEQIDNMQREGYLKNLMIARELVARGQAPQAAEYMERAASFHPDFGVLVTSPATMNDGSQQVMGYIADEMTEEQRTPGMILTTDVIDRMMMLGEDPATFAATVHDRRMAEEALRLRQEGLGLRQAEFGRRVEADRADYQTKNQPKPPSRKEFMQVADDHVKMWTSPNPETGVPHANLTPQQISKFRQAMAEAADNPVLLKLHGSIEALAQAAMERVLAGVE
jgi:hypothetical protein